MEKNVMSIMIEGLNLLPEEQSNKIIFSFVKTSIEEYEKDPSKKNNSKVIRGCALVLEVKMKRDLGSDVVDKHERQVKEIMDLMKEVENDIIPKKGDNDD
jgi:hypothetical protein